MVTINFDASPTGHQTHSSNITRNNVTDLSTVANSTTGQQRDTSHVITIWFTITIAVNVFGSLLLILLLWTTTHARNHHTGGTRHLITHLMLLQLLLLGFIFPVNNTQGYLAVIGQNNTGVTVTYRPPINCPTLSLIQVVTQHAEAWAASLLAINRFVATFFPHYYPRLTSGNAVIAMITLPWAIGLGTNLPMWFNVGGRYIVGNPYPICILVTTGVHAKLWAALGAYVPIGLMGVVCGVLLVRLLFGGRRKHHAGIVPSAASAAGLESQNQASTTGRGLKSALVAGRVARARQLTLTKMLLLSFVWYALCFLPISIVGSAFPHLVAWYMNPLWLGRTLTGCGISSGPVSLNASKTWFSH